MTKTKNLYKAKGGFNDKIAESEFYRNKNNSTSSGELAVIPTFKPLPKGMAGLERKHKILRSENGQEIVAGHTWSFIKVTRNGHKMWLNWDRQLRTMVKIIPDMINKL